MRPDRLHIHMVSAMLWSLRSKCSRAQVGAIITNNKMSQVLSIGYNGPASGVHESRCSGQPGACGCLHAEENALLKLESRHPGMTMICTVMPCPMCVQRIAQCGIKYIVYLEDYRNSVESRKYCEECDIHFHQLLINDQVPTLPKLMATMTYPSPRDR